MKKLILLLTLGLSTASFADDLIDVYGTSQQKSAALIKKYGKEIISLNVAINKSFSDFAIGKNDEKKLQELTEKKTKLINKIKKDGDFLYADLDLIHYIYDKNTYTTLEVIEKTAPQRLAFITPKKLDEPKKQDHDIFAKVEEYNTLSVKLAMQHKVSKKISCPVYHCTFGFKHPTLAPYLQIFNQAAIKDKDTILQVLKSSTNDERRCDAAFLVGHFKDPKEIFSTLTPYINDPSWEVRNDVIRILDTTEKKSKLAINLEPFLKLFASPYASDRNKVLGLIMNSLPNNPGIKKLLLEKSKEDLLNMLALKQPNNHALAYKILKKISGKNYGEYDLAAWEKWSKLQA